MNIPKKKVGVNDKCTCGSNKKYKKCCLPKQINQKMEMNKIYSIGHETDPESVNLIECMSYLIDTYPNHTIINISNYLTADTYKTFQTKNYYEKTIMVAERNKTNDSVFITRGPESVDMMIMYQGAYRCFDFKDFHGVYDHIDKLINK